MRIGIAVDGSEHALHALQTSLALARSMSGPVELVLVHVSYDSLASPVAREIDRRQVAEYLDQLAEADLQVAVEQLAETQLPFRVIKAHGEVVPTLLSTIDAEQFDLIVVGGKGRGNLADLLIGSVASRLTQLSPVPVLVVPKSTSTGA